MTAEIDRIKALAGLIDDDDDDLFGSVEEKRSLFEKKPQEQPVSQTQFGAKGSVNRQQRQHHFRPQPQLQPQPQPKPKPKPQPQPQSQQTDEAKKWKINNHAPSSTTNTSRTSVKDMAKTAIVIKNHPYGQLRSTEPQQDQKHDQQQQQPVNQELHPATSSLLNSKNHSSNSYSSNQFKQQRKNNLDGFLKAQNNHAIANEVMANHVRGVSANNNLSKLNTNNNHISSGHGIGQYSSSTNLQAATASAPPSRPTTVGKLSIHQIAHFKPQDNGIGSIGSIGDGMNDDNNKIEEKDHCIFGKPQTFGAAGGEVETDRIPNVRERAMAINQWKIWEKNHKRNGHARAAQWKLGSSTSTCSTAPGDGNSIREEPGQLDQHGHPHFNGGSALYGGDSCTVVSTRSRTSKAPPSFLSQFEQDEEEQSQEEVGSAISVADTSPQTTAAPKKLTTSPKKNSYHDASNALSSPRNNSGVLTPRNGNSGNATINSKNESNETNSVSVKKNSQGKEIKPGILSYFRDDDDAHTPNGPDDELAALATKEKSLTSPRTRKSRTLRKQATVYPPPSPGADISSPCTIRLGVANSSAVAAAPSPRVENTGLPVMKPCGNSSWVLPSPKQSRDGGMSDASDAFGFGRDNGFGFDVNGKDFNSSKETDYGFDDNDFSFGFGEEKSESDVSTVTEQRKESTAGGRGTEDDFKESSIPQPRLKQDDVGNLMNEASKSVCTACQTDSDLDDEEDVGSSDKKAENDDHQADDYWDEELMSAKELAMALDRLLHLNDGDDEEAEEDKEKADEDQSLDGNEPDKSLNRHDVVSVITRNGENLPKNAIEIKNKNTCTVENSMKAIYLEKEAKKSSPTLDRQNQFNDSKNNEICAWERSGREPNRDCISSSDPHVDKVSFPGFAQKVAEGTQHHVTPPTPNYRDEYSYAIESSFENSTAPLQLSESVESTIDVIHGTYSLDSSEEKPTVSATKAKDAGRTKYTEKKPPKIKIQIDGAPKFELREDPNKLTEEHLFFFHQASPRVGDDACLLASISPEAESAKTLSKELGEEVKAKEMSNKFIQTTSVIGRKLDIKGFFHSTMPAKREHHSGEGLLADPHKLTTIDTSAFDSFDFDNLDANNSMTSNYFFARAPSPSNAVNLSDNTAKKKHSQVHLTFGPSAMAAAAAAAGSPFKHDILSNEAENEQDYERSMDNEASGSFGSSKKKSRKLFRSIKMKAPLGRKRRNYEQHQSLNDSYRDLEFC
ncbi:hypothetical protein ACHAXS_010272 [Conticribra weissflogii]